MPIDAGSITSNDLVTPIVAQLCTVAQQLAGIGTCYAQLPDRAPEDNSVLFPLRRWQTLDDTDAKLKVELTFEVLHLFRRQDLNLALAAAYPWVLPWLQVLNAWANSGLGGLAVNVSTMGQQGTVKQYSWAGEPFIAISNSVSVLTEFNILTQ